MAELGGTHCCRYEHYVIVDTKKGFYEVWYDCGNRDFTEWVSDHETEFGAWMNAKCYAHADAVLAKKRAALMQDDNINRFMGSENVYDSVVGRF